jgi:probable HAF family extracellular repeat protein
VIGGAETQKDPSCQAPQVFGFEAVIWQPGGNVTPLPPYGSDPISLAFGINDRGDAVVGASGQCGPLSNIGNAVHAVLWKNGKPKDLGNLGGSVFNAAFSVNDRGQIVGISGVAGSGAFHAFLWKKGKMSDLGTLPGGVYSLPNTINDRGQVVGFSIDASGNNTAVIWENGSIKDLNSLVPPNSRLHLMIASNINNRGWIVGDALDAKTGHTLGVLLIPSNDAALSREEALR